MSRGADVPVVSDARAARKKTARNACAGRLLLIVFAACAASAPANSAPPMASAPVVVVPVSVSAAPVSAPGGAIVLPSTTRLPDPERDRMHALEARVAELEREAASRFYDEHGDRIIASSTLGYLHRPWPNACRTGYSSSKCVPRGRDAADLNASFAGTPHRSPVLRFAADSMPRSTKADATYSRHVLSFARNSGVNVGKPARTGTQRWRGPRGR